MIGRISVDSGRYPVMFSNINEYTTWQSVAPKCPLHTLYYQCANPSIIVRLHDQGASYVTNVRYKSQKTYISCT